MYPTEMTTSPEFKLSPAHLDVLRRAAHDDAFRGELARNPAAALAQCGIEFDAQLAARVALPEKQAIQSVLDDITEPVTPGFIRWQGFLGEVKGSTIH